MDGRNLLELIGILFTIVAILALAFVATRYMGKLRFHGFSRSIGGGGRMKVLDQLALGRDTRILLVQIGTRILLLSATASEVSLLTELSEEEAASWLDSLQGQASLSAQTDHPSFRDSFLETLKQRRK